LFIYKTVEDEISPVADADKLVAEYCAEGGVSSTRIIPSGSITPGRAQAWTEKSFCMI
jgi:hypothetical protein